MAGLAFYILGSLGFSLYLPARSAVGVGFAGVNLVAGYAMMVLSLVVWAAVFRFDNQTTVFMTSALALGGFAVWIWRCRSGRGRAMESFNPVFLLLVVGLVVVAVEGGVAYTPTTNDEFTNWIGASRLIHFADSFARIKDGLNHAGYLPGWRLLLMAPWQFGGRLDMGLSAAAPFVLYVAVLALLYDLVTSWASIHWQIRGWSVAATGLFVVFLFAAAEGLGRVWPLYLLIEPPQIMTYAALVLVILAADLAAEERDRLWRRAGLILAASVSLKTAAVIWVPGLILAVAAGRFAASAHGSRPDWPSVLRRVIWAVGPALAVFLAWKQIQHGHASCVSDAGALVAGGFASIMEDWTAGGFLGRYIDTIGGYILAYKTVLTVASVVGVALALRARTGTAAIIAFVVFAAGYFFFLYLANLVCWVGGVEELTSYQRYSRVAVQTFHALGLALLVLAAVRFAGQGRVNAAALLENRAVRAAVVVGTAVLVLWQIGQVRATVADLEVRTRWPADPRILEMRRAAAYVMARRGTDLPLKPRVLVVDQGGDVTAAKYLHYFATVRGANGPETGVDIPLQVSWSDSRSGIDYKRATREQVSALFAGADVVWLRRTDAWVQGILVGQGAPPDCRDILVRKRGHDGFVCDRKP